MKTYDFTTVQHFPCWALLWVVLCAIHMQKNRPDRKKNENSDTINFIGNCGGQLHKSKEKEPLRKVTRTETKNSMRVNRKKMPFEYLEN